MAQWLRAQGALSNDLDGLTAPAWQVMTPFYSGSWGIQCPLLAMVSTGIQIYVQAKYLPIPRKRKEKINV